jgi:redox-sensitive bicupin YhaK (pirin superfamily)
MANSRDVHVVGNSSGGWRVTQRGRMLSQHRLQRRAVQAGTRVARRERLDVVTHARDGRVRSKDSHGNEGRARDTEH